MNSTGRGLRFLPISIWSPLSASQGNPLRLSYGTCLPLPNVVLFPMSQQSATCHLSDSHRMARGCLSLAGWVSLGYVIHAEEDRGFRSRLGYFLRWSMDSDSQQNRSDSI